jgi:hypothetical protein
MRKVAGLVVLVAAMAVPAGMIASSPAGAVGGTTCSTAAGTAKFAPALPILGSKVLVKGTLTSTGTVGKCVGGGVTTGHTAFKSPKSTTGANCTTLAKPDPKSKGTIGSFVITWNTGKTSTVKTFTIKQVKGAPTHATVGGKITAGLFVGSTVKGTVAYKLPVGACSKKPLAQVTYSALAPTKFTIK